MHKRFFAILGLLILLSACGSGAVIGQYQKGRLHDYYRYAAVDQHLLIKVTGEAFGVSGEETARRIFERLPQPAFLPPTTYTLDDKQAERPAFHLAILVNPGPGEGAPSVCDGVAKGAPGATGGDLTMTMAFCHKGQIAASAKGWVSGLSGFDDPKFDAFLASVVNMTMPNEMRMDRGCPPNKTNC